MTAAFKTQVSTPRATIAPTVIVIEKMVGCGTCSTSTGNCSTNPTNIGGRESK
jgi:hypothetical protein